MANTLILVDRRDNPWRKVNVTLRWDGGGSDRVWVNDSGRGDFYGTGLITEVQAPGETIRVHEKVNGNSTIVARSRNAH